MERLHCLVLLLAIFPALVMSQNSPVMLKPKSYNLKITLPESPTSNTFEGHIELNFTPPSSSSVLVLEAENLKIASYENDISISRTSQNQKIDNITWTETALIINCSNSLKTLGYKMNIKFTGTFQNEMRGFAKVPLRFKDQDTYLGVTSFEPNFARRVFPCSNDPSVKAKFVLEVTVNQSQTVVSNVKHSTSYNTSDNTRTVFRFDSYPAMPVYQLGWAVFDSSIYNLHEVQATSGSKAIHTWTPKLYENYTTWACQFTSNLMSKFGEYLGKPYPPEELQQVVVPHFFSGTSKGYGILSYSEEAILVSPQQTSSRDKQKVALAISEGVISQWFGDLIAMDSWEHMWLVKGLSEYLKYSFSSSLDGMVDWELNDHVVVELVQKAFSLDNKNNSLTIDALDEQTKVEIAYNDATKYKAAAIIRMLQYILGKEIFDSGLQYYMEVLEGTDKGKPEYFWKQVNIAAEEAKLDLRNSNVSYIMNPWVVLKGHPVVNVSVNESHFLISQAENFTTGPLHIPITYMLQNSPSKTNKTWLRSGSTLAIPKYSNLWILVNVNQTGFYRVNYDKTLWAELQNQLRTNHSMIPRISRSQLIDDLFSFAIDGVLSMDLLMKFTQYLENEVDYFPWYTALRNFENILDNIYGFDSYNLLQNHLLSLMKKVVLTVGFSSNLTDSHTEKMRQSLVLEKACALGHPNCKEATSILDKYVDQSFYDPDVSAALLCAGVAKSSSEKWWKLQESLYSESVFYTVRAHIIAALSCSSNTTLLKEFLTNITLSSQPPLNEKDRRIFLEKKASTPAGAEFLLDWLLESLSSDTHQTVQPDPVTKPVTEAETPKPNTASNSTDAPADATDSIIPVNSNNTEKAEPLTKSKRDVSEPLLRTLTDNQVKAILVLAFPKLSTQNQGTKLEKLLNVENLPFFNETRTFIQNMAKLIYKKGSVPTKYNEMLSIWLTNNIGSSNTSTAGSSSNSVSISTTTTTVDTTTKGTSGAQGVHSSHAILATSVILLSLSYYS